MTVEQLQTLIAQSKILTDAEKQYWSSSLPKMSPEQHQKLEGILQRAQQIPWTDKIQQYFTLVAKSAQASASQVAAA